MPIWNMMKSKMTSNRIRVNTSLKKSLIKTRCTQVIVNSKLTKSCVNCLNWLRKIQINSKMAIGPRMTRPGLASRQKEACRFITTIFKRTHITLWKSTWESIHWTSLRTKMALEDSLIRFQSEHMIAESPGK
jgi:hypothetical protein